MDIKKALEMVHEAFPNQAIFMENKAEAWYNHHHPNDRVPAYKARICIGQHCDVALFEGDDLKELVDQALRLALKKLGKKEI